MRTRHEQIYDFEVRFEPNGKGYTVTVPKLPGLVTEGGNLVEARLMAKDAIRCHLEALLKDKVAVLGKREKIRRNKVRITIPVG